jgi:hypothetical protein
MVAFLKGGFYLENIIALLFCSIQVGPIKGQVHSDVVREDKEEALCLVLTLSPYSLLLFSAALLPDRVRSLANLSPNNQLQLSAIRLH